MTWEQQSPINLRATFSARASRDYLKLAWSTAVNGFLRAGEHGVEVLFGVSPDKYLELEGKRFQLKQFHFHHPSEHLVDATSFDGEVHLVHQNLDDLTIAVVGIFLTVEATGDGTAETAKLIKYFKDAKSAGTTIPLTPCWWLPSKHDHLFRYEGSLTTDPYAETVSWMVFPEPKAISADLFESIFGGHPQKARALQARNRRYIVDVTLKPIIV